MTFTLFGNVHTLNEGRKVYLNLETNSLAKISLRNFLSSLISRLKNVLFRKYSVLFLLRVHSSPADSHNSGNRPETALWGSGSFSVTYQIASISSTVNSRD